MVQAAPLGRRLCYEACACHLVVNSYLQHANRDWGIVTHSMSLHSTCIVLMSAIGQVQAFTLCTRQAHAYLHETVVLLLPGYSDGPFNSISWRAVDGWVQAKGLLAPVRGTCWVWRCRQGHLHMSAPASCQKLLPSMQAIETTSAIALSVRQNTQQATAQCSLHMKHILALLVTVSFEHI